MSNSHSESSHYAASPHARPSTSQEALLADVVLDEVAGLREVARDTAVAAAELVRTMRADLNAAGGVGTGVETKSSAVDPVTVVDKATEEFIVSELARLRPRDGLLGEEGAGKPSESGFTWIIDPIDGTVNFLFGVPACAVSVGVVFDGEPVAGAVVSVDEGLVYHAGVGQGAVKENIGAGTADNVGAASRPSRVTPLKARENADVHVALLATGFGYSSQRRRQQAELLTRVLPEVRDIRRMGAAALDLCRVAEGSVDAYYEHGVKAWDCAAGTIIAREAGAVVQHCGLFGAQEDEIGGEFFFAASASVAPALLRLLTEAGVTNAIS